MGEKVTPFKSFLRFLLALGFSILSWVWAFIIVGSAFFDFVKNQPISNVSSSTYVTHLVVNLIFTYICVALYVYLYHMNNKIIFDDNWAKDSLLLGFIMCVVNFSLDAIFFGLVEKKNLLSYFFIESTTGYIYPTMIFQVWMISYFIYGKKKDKFKSG